MKLQNEVNGMNDYKFNDKSYLYELFSKIITKNEKICGILEKYDIIIPVPIHKKRKQKRGYNQSEIITRQISKKIPSLVHENTAIQKIKHNIEQSSLSKEQRKQNVKDVYKIVNKERTFFLALAFFAKCAIILALR